MGDRELVIQIYEEDNMIWIDEDDALGSEYEGTTPADIGYAVECYLEDNPKL